MNEDLPPPFVVTRISDGVEFGEGAISGAAEEDHEVLTLMDEAIRSRDILVPVEAEDDGCSDGRPAIMVFMKHRIFKHSLHRAKVFGGAVAMTAASKIGLGQAHDQQLSDVFGSSIDTLTDREISFGAHTDENAHGEDCGCGAIDRAPGALRAAVDYESQIRGVIGVLGVDQTGLDEVFDNFRQYKKANLSESAADDGHGYSGRKVMEKIVSAGKVVKKLGGQHLERRIVLNQARGYTVNQRVITLVTGGKAQVFAIDAWRLEDIAGKLYPDQPETQHKAVLSELVYTLGVSAVLTKGDLPIDLIQPEAAPDES